MVVSDGINSLSAGVQELAVAVETYSLSLVAQGMIDASTLPWYTTNYVPGDSIKLSRNHVTRVNVCENEVSQSSIECVSGDNDTTLRAQTVFTEMPSSNFGLELLPNGNLVEPLMTPSEVIPYKNEDNDCHRYEDGELQSRVMDLELDSYLIGVNGGLQVDGNRMCDVIKPAHNQFDRMSGQRSQIFQDFASEAVEHHLFDEMSQPHVGPIDELHGVSCCILGCNLVDEVILSNAQNVFDKVPIPTFMLEMAQSAETTQGMVVENTTENISSDLRLLFFILAPSECHIVTFVAPDVRYNLAFLELNNRRDSHMADNMDKLTSGPLWCERLDDTIKIPYRQCDDINCFGDKATETSRHGGLNCMEANNCIRLGLLLDTTPYFTYLNLPRTLHNEKFTPNVKHDSPLYKNAIMGIYYDVQCYWVYDLDSNVYKDKCWMKSEYKFFDPGIGMTLYVLLYSLTLEDKGDFRGVDDTSETYTRELFNPLILWRNYITSRTKKIVGLLNYVFDPGGLCSQIDVLDDHAHKSWLPFALCLKEVRIESILTRRKDMLVEDRIRKQDAMKCNFLVIMTFDYFTFDPGGSKYNLLGGLLILDPKVWHYDTTWSEMILKNHFRSHVVSCLIMSRSSFISYAGSENEIRVFSTCAIVIDRKELDISRHLCFNFIKIWNDMLDEYPYNIWLCLFSSLALCVCKGRLHMPNKHTGVYLYRMVWCVTWVTSHVGAVHMGSRGCLIKMMMHKLKEVVQYTSSSLLKSILLCIGKECIMMEGLWALLIPGIPSVVMIAMVEVNVSTFGHDDDLSFLWILSTRFSQTKVSASLYLCHVFNNMMSTMILLSLLARGGATDVSNSMLRTFKHFKESLEIAIKRFVWVFDPGGNDEFMLMMSAIFVGDLCSFGLHGGKMDLTFLNLGREIQDNETIFIFDPGGQALNEVVRLLTYYIRNVLVSIIGALRLKLFMCANFDP